MADNVRVTRASAYVKTSPPDRAQVTRTSAYVKVRPYVDDVRISTVTAYVKVFKPWAFEYTTYRVKDGHDQTLEEEHDVTPQPTMAGIKVTRRNHSVSGGLKDEFLYAELVWSSLGSIDEFQSVLSQFGILAADENEVTITARDHAFRFKRYNGTAVRPQMGADVRHERYFVRDLVILVKYLELVE